MAESSPTLPERLLKRWPKDEDPVYFAVLEAAFRHDPELPTGNPNRYYDVARDDPGANEFRVYMHIENGMQSGPLGKDRDRAEYIVEMLNAAYNFGRVQERRMQKDPRRKDILVGRMGHLNRNEEQMP